MSGAGGVVRDLLNMCITDHVCLDGVSQHAIDSSVTGRRDCNMLLLNPFDFLSPLWTLTRLTRVFT